MAFLKKQTVIELIINGIQKSYTEISKMKYEEFGDNSDIKEIQKCSNLAFQQLLESKVGNTFQKIIEMNIDKIMNDINRDAYNRIQYYGMLERGHLKFL